MDKTLVGAVGAAGLFAATNVDDIVVLTVLFLKSRASGQPKIWQIWAGQYLGLFALVAASAAAALGLTVLPDRWVGLMGVVPIVLGLRNLVKLLHPRHPPGPGDAAAPVTTGWLAVTALTMANGADNISVYTPMFRTLDTGQTLVTVGVFAIMPALWCIAGSWLGSHKRVIALVARAGHWIVPVLFILIGVLIVLRSGLLPGLRTA